VPPCLTDGRLRPKCPKTRDGEEFGRDGSRVEFANLLRGIAAASVVLSHYLGGYWLYRREVAALTGFPVLHPLDIATPDYVAWINLVPASTRADSASRCSS